MSEHYTVYQSCDMFIDVLFISVFYELVVFVAADSHSNSTCHCFAMLYMLHVFTLF